MFKDLAALLIHLIYFQNDLISIVLMYWRDISIAHHCRVVTNTKQLPTKTVSSLLLIPFKIILELEVPTLIMSSKKVISSLKDLLIKSATGLRNTRNTT